MFGSQFCLFGSFLRLSGRVVLIFDVQFHEYLSITILTLISFSIKIYSSCFSFMLFDFRDLSHGLVNPSYCVVVSIVGFVLGFLL